jgi:hypothetical protein
METETEYSGAHSFGAARNLEQHENMRIEVTMCPSSMHSHQTSPSKGLMHLNLSYCVQVLLVIFCTLVSSPHLGPDHCQHLLRVVRVQHPESYHSRLTPSPAIQLHLQQGSRASPGMQVATHCVNLEVGASVHVNTALLLSTLHMCCTDWTF